MYHQMQCGISNSCFACHMPCGCAKKSIPCWDWTNSCFACHMPCGCATKSNPCWDWTNSCFACHMPCGCATKSIPCWDWTNIQKCRYLKTVLSESRYSHTRDSVTWIRGCCRVADYVKVSPESNYRHTGDCMICLSGCKSLPKDTGFVSMGQTVRWL